MNRSLVLVASITILAFIGCDKSAVKYNAGFEGRWRSEKPDTIGGVVLRNEILIDGKDGIFRNNCKDTCELNLCDCTNEQKGRAVVNTGKTHIKFGSANSSPLTIDQEPFVDSTGKTKMKIGSVVYLKQ